jgi:hypothetical protein
MVTHKVFRSRSLVVGLVAAFVLLVTPVAEFAQQGRAPAPASGSLVGFIYAKDMKTPVANAVVKLRNTAKAASYQSLPSDANGMYKITGIEEGRYVLGVTAGQGDFNFEYGLFLKGNEMAKLSVALTPFESSAQPSGQDPGAASFFTSPAGIVALVIIAGAVVYGLTANKAEESPVNK